MHSMPLRTSNQKDQPVYHYLALTQRERISVVNPSGAHLLHEHSLSCRCGEGISKWKYIEAKCAENFWKAQHARALARETEAQAEIEKLKAKLRLRESQLFGKKTEQPGKSEKTTLKENAPPKKRGHQPGQKGHGRQANPDLAVKEEVIELPESQRVCPSCQKLYEEFPETEDSDILEIEVSAHKRKIKRKRYHAGCKCPGTPGMLTAPAVGRLIPQGKIGVSLWVKILLDKYEYYRPTHRLLSSLKNLGLDLPQGTVTDGLKKLEPLFKPLYDAIAEFNRNDEHLWNADETRWEVFTEQENKVGHRWYLWVFAALKSVIFFIEPTRSKTVPQNHLGNSQGKLVIDRYKAYFILLKTGKIILIFCWAHVRRDFLTHAKKYPKEENWAMDWVREIRNLYYINAQRTSAWITQNDEALKNTQTRLEKAIEDIFLKSRIQQEDPTLSKESKKVLKSLDYHRQGLEAFVQSAEIPMDNNRGERILRGPVVGRKGFYGSGSRWSALLTAMLFSVLQTLKLWKINPETWMTLFLQTCADNRGKLPDDWERFLPWKMTQAQLNSMSKPIIHSNTS
jgi:transposase